MTKRAVCDNPRCKWYGLPRTVEVQEVGRDLFLACLYLCVCGFAVTTEDAA